MTGGIDGGFRPVAEWSASRRALLARRLRATVAGRARDSSRDGPLVRLTPGTERDPLFLVHAVSGTVHAYARLATHLADAVTLYGIEAGGLENGSEPRASVEDMASAYLQLIRHVQP
ncbi:MAG: thioesterase domain-containing protein, partial [Pseudonocardiaceae bacterium]